MATKTRPVNESRTPNAENKYSVSRNDLPLHCPMPDMSLWNSHPRVFLPIEETGAAKCPYCGAEFTLID
ncbi:MAG: zinc-finger domain-containing protein [Gammaproteobacteria bacterium]